MNIGTRLTLLLTLLLGLLGGAIAYGLCKMSSIKDELNDINVRYAPLVDEVVTVAIKQERDSAELEQRLLGGGNSTYEWDSTASVAAWEIKALDYIDVSGFSHMDARERQQVEAARNAIKEFATTRSDFLKQVTAVTAKDAILANSARGQAESLLQTANKLSDASVDRALEHHEKASQMLIWLAAAGISLAILLGYLMIRSITRPLRFVTDSAHRVSEGKLNLEWQYMQRRDELGDLVRSFRQLVDYLESAANLAVAVGQGDLSVNIVPKSADDRLGQALREMVGNLHEAIRQVQQAVHELASSTSQITSTTSEFASSSTETASAIAETTATVAEVRQTAELVNEKANLVARNAENVDRVSRDGFAAVEGSEAAMNTIQIQMQSIAEGILALSDQSQAIAAIIDSVEDLAEQSNLLAVNASIEASKAGEHGKGFAVVAQEIRNLANESKRSTAQVRGILGDIQKATNKAVMVTEQGNKAVEQGVAQARQASEAVASLNSVVDDAAISASQIAASSQEQLVGMEQVACAMSDIKTASNQNAEGSRLLEDAGRGLKDLGQRLQALVAKYRVSN